MYEKEMINFMRNLGLQVHNLDGSVQKMEKAIRGLRITGNTITKVVPFGVKDVSSAQLLDAFQRGLDMEQLVALSDGKYTPEQIYKKLQKMGGIQ